MCRQMNFPALLIFLLSLAAGAARADITSDLLGYWALDGNAQDNSGNGYHGEEFGGPSYVPGIMDQAIECKGDQSVYIPDFTGIQDRDAVTICMWVIADRSGGEDQVMWFTDEDGSYGRVRFRVDGDEWEWRHGDGLSNIVVESPVIVGEWTHLAGARENGAKLELFVNGISAGEASFGNAGVAEPQGSIGAERRSPTSVRQPFEGVIDEVRFYTRALSAADVQELFEYRGRPPVRARRPQPGNGSTDIPRDGLLLSWTPGDFAQTHNVYLGKTFIDVSDAVIGSDSLTSENQEPNTLALGRLDFGQTYYWRVDEVNAPSDAMVFEGDVWSFTVEPLGYPLPGSSMTASASSVGSPEETPERTIDGSGLDANDLHSTTTTAMWLSSSSAPGQAWIRYDFDKSYRLHQMLVWNYNGESFLSWSGLKEVTVEYSADGEIWTPLDNVPEFTQAPGTDDYGPDIVIDLNGLMAKHVRITAHSNWSPGGVLDQYGLSEVRFLYIPMRAREPSPANGSTNVEPAMELRWRAGRQAGAHDVYLGSDRNNLSLADVVTGSPYATYDTAALDLLLGQTYYWQVDEVNEVEVPSIWEGDILEFSTREYFVVDDFERYDDDWENFNRIFQVWIDGAGYTSPEPGHPGNGSGSLVGTSAAPWVEEDIVRSGGQSMPLAYDNTAAPFYSEAERTFAPAQDWTRAGVATLVLFFSGDPANTGGQVYVTINGVKAEFNGDAGAIAQPSWTQWNIDLASTGANLRNVTKLSVGVEGGESGVLYVDDILLYRLAPAPPAQGI